MKKLWTVVLTVICSVILTPLGVNAATYEEFIDFAIASYDKEAGNFSMTIELMKDMAIGRETFVAEYEDETGKKLYDNFVYMGGTALDEDPDGNVGDHIVGTVPIKEGYTKVTLYVDLAEYKGELVFDLNNFVRDPSSKYPASYPDKSSIIEQSSGLGNDVESVFVDITENTKLDKSYLEEAINNKTYLFAANGNDEKINYMWVFDGTVMEHANYDLDLKITIGSSKNDKLIASLLPTTKDTPLHLDFAHHGELPKGTGVIINVDGIYNENDKLSLYYFNEETKKLEEVDTEILFEDGIVGFELEHCSEYVLVKENAAPNNAQTSSMNVLLYGGIAAICVGGVVFLSLGFKKKED